MAEEMDESDDEWWAAAAAAALRHATTEGDAARTQMLIAAGADINGADMGGSTPLHVACFFGRTACAQLLLEAGADVEKADICGWTPLHEACVRGRLACVKLLSSYGASRTFRYGRPAEALAQLYGNHNLAAWLARTRDWTPLHHLEQLTPQRVRALLRDGADPHAAPAAGVPSPAERARTLDPPTDASNLLLDIVEPWSPATHDTFPAAARARAVELVRLGRLLAARRYEAEFQAVYDLWRERVMPHAVCRRGDNLEDTCGGDADCDNDEGGTQDALWDEQLLEVVPAATAGPVSLSADDLDVVALEFHALQALAEMEG